MEKSYKKVWENPSVKNKKDADLFLEMPTVRQATTETCGEACIVSIMEYYGFNVAERHVLEAVKLTDKNTYPEAIARGMKIFGLKSKVFRDMTPEDLQSYLNKKTPVILEIQAWGDKKDYSEVWTEGHYVVACGYDKGGFYFMDPSQLGYSYLKTDDLIDCWHDKDGSKKNYRLGIIIYGKKPRYDQQEVRLIKAHRVIFNLFQRSGL